MSKIDDFKIKEDEEEVATTQFKAAKKKAKATKERVDAKKKNLVVSEETKTIVSSSGNTKVVKIVRMSNGLKYSRFVGTVKGLQKLKELEAKNKKA